MIPAPLSTHTGPLVIGHRGASGHAPDNSLAAFRLAADSTSPSACDGVELDIQHTRDGELVVFHDERLADGRPVMELDLRTLRAERLRDGSTIPTLGEALDVLARIEAFIEVKRLPAELDGTLLDLLATHPSRHHVHSFDHRIIARLRSRGTRLSLGALSTSYPVDPVTPVRNAGADTLWQEASLIDGALVSACAAAGIRVIAWTVNDAREADRLRALGVAGLCGNWPERLREW